MPRGIAKNGINKGWFQKGNHFNTGKSQFIKGDPRIQHHHRGKNLIQSKPFRSKLYLVWRDMKYRCYNPSSKDYKNYGRRGIKVCDRWLLSFDYFYEDMVMSYKSGLWIDRINNDGNYEPCNCRWSTPSEQAFNKKRNMNFLGGF